MGSVAFRKKESVMPAEKNNPAGAPITACHVDHGCTVVSCAVCLAEIPSDVALSFEGPDYVQHFCGLSCLDVWKQKPPENK